MAAPGGSLWLAAQHVRRGAPPPPHAAAWGGDRPTRRRRGHRPSQNRPGSIRVVLRGSVGAEAGQEAWLGSCTPVSRDDHRLLDLSQTDGERSRNNIRSPEVRDPCFWRVLLGSKGAAC